MSDLTIALKKVDFPPPDRVTDDTSVLTLKNLVLEPLLRWQAGGRVRPALFAAWTETEGGRRWRFFIRSGARFHDGVLCTADDIVAFIAAIRDGVDTFGMKWSYARYLADTRIVAVANDCVEVTNPEPFADILDIFAEFYPVRRDASGAAILGTGPYRVARFEPGVSATLARGEPGPGPERIVFVAAKDADGRYERLRRGAVDAALNLERRHDGTFDPDLTWGRAENTLSVMFYLNCAGGLFANAAARMAANLAVDKPRMIADLFRGLGVPASTIVSPFHLGMGAAGIAPIPHDPDRARRLLDTAGATGRVRLRTPTFMPDRAPAISAFVAEALGAIGLEVTIETETDRPDYARQVGRKEIGDMAIFDSSPQSTFRVLDDKISSATKAIWWQGFDDAETESLFAAARRAAGDDAREAAYGSCLARLNAHPPWLYLFHPIDVFACRAGITGLSIDHRGALHVA